VSIYFLTFQESWALAELLRLPVQPGSAFANWLDSDRLPDANRLPGTTLQTLAAKGYYDGNRANQPFSPGLLASLTLLSVNAAELTAVIRVGADAALTRFAQVGEGVVQYGTDENKLALHDVTPAKSFTKTIIPSWFIITANEHVWADIPLGAFILLKSACALQDWNALRFGLDTETFSQTDLLASFRSSAGWVDVFSAAAVKGVLSMDQMPVEEYLEHLIARGYLKRTGEDLLEVGSAGKPLAAVLTDPGLCTLTLSLQLWEDPQVTSGAFLHGGGRLFLLEFSSGRLAIQQYGSLENAHLWVESLLGKGSLAHYETYAIPPAPSAPDPVEASPTPQPVRNLAPSPAAAPPQPAHQAAWYYLIDGKQVGPVSEGNMRAWLAQGRLSTDTLVWTAGQRGWVKASQVRWVG